jgi:hypothetical protein
MIVYKVFYKDYELERSQLLGVLCERRKNLRGMNQFGSGMRWAKKTFGGLVKDEEAIFVMPSELKYAQG